MNTRLHSTLLRALVPGLLVLLSACPFSPNDSKKPPVVVDPYQAQNSPAAILHNLKKAYVEGNYTEYQKLFDPTEYVFQFAPVDVENGLPAEWRFNDEMASAQALFENQDVIDVRLGFTPGEPQPATDADNLPNGPAGVTKVIVSEVHLEVETRQTDGENLIYLVEGDYQDFFFRQYPGEPAPTPGTTLWRIVRWKDQATGDGLRSVGSVRHELAGR